MSHISLPRSLIHVRKEEEEGQCPLRETRFLSPGVGVEQKKTNNGTLCFKNNSHKKLYFNQWTNPAGIVI